MVKINQKERHEIMVESAKLPIDKFDDIISTFILTEKDINKALEVVDKLGNNRLFWIVETEENKKIADRLLELFKGVLYK